MALIDFCVRVRSNNRSYLPYARVTVYKNLVITCEQKLRVAIDEDQRKKFSVTRPLMAMYGFLNFNNIKLVFASILFMITAITLYYSQKVI